MRTIIISILALFWGTSFNPSTSIAQIKGTVSVGWSIGFITKGGAFVKYYPLDGVAVEVFGGGFPHILHGGAEFSIHPFMLTHDGYRNLAFTVGYSWFRGGRNPVFSGQGINIGAEFMFTTRQSQFFVMVNLLANFYTISDFTRGFFDGFGVTVGSIGLFYLVFTLIKNKKI